MSTFFTLVKTKLSRSLSPLAFVISMLALVGTAPQAQAASGFFNNYIIVSGNNNPGGVSPYFYHANATFNQPFQSANLGTYDRATGSLILNGAEANTFENGGDVIYSDSTMLFFRVYKQLAANGDAGQGGAFQRIRLPQTSVAGNGDRRFETSAGTITRPNSTPMTVNLVNLASGPGVYVVEAFLRASGINNGTTKFRIFDSNSSANYKATFTISGAAGTGQASTVWLGGENPGCIANGDPTQETALLIGASNWFDPINWTNGVPTAVTNTEVPNYSGSNLCVVYPNIRGNAQTGPATTKNLVLRGLNGANRSIMRLITGNLRVSGTFDQEADNYIQRANTTFTLACSCDQTFDGSDQFINFHVEGANSRKTLNGLMVVSGVLVMEGGVLVTSDANPLINSVRLNTGARIQGENENTYVEGILISDEVTVPGVFQGYGNIGLDLVFTAGDPGSVRVTRTTKTTVASNLGSKPSIRRYFGVRPFNATSGANPLAARFGVRYLDRELVQVSNGFSPTPQDLNETQLTIWTSTSGGGSFANEGRDRIDPTNNRVTQNNITVFATTTLGENTAPLPVNFTNFSVARSNRVGAVLNWSTAQEIDNAGFEVQVSNDGREFRTLTTVRPASANSTSARHYSYTDETAFGGTRYYRLRQVDTNGHFAYTPVRVVNFGGGNSELEAATSTVFPNPFHDGEQLLMNVKAAIAGKALVRITDALGREVASQTNDVPAGSSTVLLPSLSGKPAGMYLVRLSMPNGTAQTIKVQKQ